MKMATIPANDSFFDVVADRWIKGGAKGDGVILLPNARSAMQMTEAFLRLSDGAAMLLPRIVPFSRLETVLEPTPGVLPEADHLNEQLSGGLDALLDLPPACAPMQRLVALTRLVLQSGAAFSVLPGPGPAWKLAEALAELMDDAEHVGVELAKALPDAAEGQFASHWERSLLFLNIVTQHWPELLSDHGVINPVARQTAIVSMMIASLQTRPQPVTIWAVGFMDAATSVGPLLQAIAQLPSGYVILPGLDQDLDAELWDRLPESHPQSGMKRLIDVLAVERQNVAVWTKSFAWAETASSARLDMLRAALAPASGVARWLRDPAPCDLTGLSMLKCEDSHQEARAIAMIIRNALENPGQRIALITPDREIARRVSVQLLRFGIVADDSAGEPLALTPSAVFLRLLADAAVAGFAPVELLALLKHPLCAAGLTPGACRASARRLERLAIRGPAPPPGFAGLRQRCRGAADGEAALADRPDQPVDPEAFIDLLEAKLEPLLALPDATLPAHLTCLISVAEALASSPDSPGEARLWSGEAGHALAEHLSNLLQYTAELGQQRFAVVPDFLNVTLQGQNVMGQHILRGRDAGQLHPRVHILGLLEARLQRFDVSILAGLNEQIWPALPEPGPWLSRPMRIKVGLPTPERSIGLSAFDFVSGVCSAPRVVLSQVTRRDEAPAMPSRWLVRLEAYLGGRGQALPLHPAMAWQARIDQHDGAAQPAPQPRPKPPVALRPRRLSVTEIETWLQDPYAIYARHVLKLRPLEPLNAPAGRAEIGVLVHDAMAEWKQKSAGDESHLRKLLHQALESSTLRQSMRIWWQGRVDLIAEEVLFFENREDFQPVQTWVELPGKLRLEAPAGHFDLTARADRLDRDAEGRLRVIDYKTGTVPARWKTDSGWSSQLWLEAAMALHGGFSRISGDVVAKLEYWRLSGRASTDAVTVIADGDKLDVAEEAVSRLEKLQKWITRYDDPDMPYASQPHPDYAPRFDDYGHLARVREWRISAEVGEE